MTTPAPRVAGEGVRIYTKTKTSQHFTRVTKYLKSLGVTPTVEDWSWVCDAYIGMLGSSANTRTTAHDIDTLVNGVSKRIAKDAVLTVVRRGEVDFQFLGSSDEALLKMGEELGD